MPFCSFLLLLISEGDANEIYHQALQVIVECDIIALHAHAILTSRHHSETVSDGQLCFLTSIPYTAPNLNLGILKLVSDLATHLERPIAQSVIHMFQPSLLDWVKTRQQLEMRLVMCTRDDPLVAHHARNRAAWLLLEDNAKYLRLRKIVGHSCMYPRCPDPDPIGGAWICFMPDVGKGYSYYCSVRCQQG